MALMRRFSVSGTSASGAVTYTFILCVTNTHVDEENNKSHVSVQVILKQDYNGVSFSERTTNYSCSINDSQVFSVSKQHSLIGTSEHVFYTWNGVLDHNADGTLLIKVGGSLSVDDPTEDMPQPLTISGNDTMALTPIAVFTACSPPGSFSVEDSLFEKYIDLSWSIATRGRNNPITGYIIAAGISQNGREPTSRRVIWTGEETSVRFTETWPSEGMLEIDPGQYLWFWIRSMGAAGEEYYSDWITTKVKRNTHPNAPSSASVAPTVVRKSERVTIVWEPASVPDEDGNLTGYLIEYSEDNKKWYQLSLAPVKAREYSFTPREIDAIQYMYLRISAIDHLEAVSDPVFVGMVQQVDVDNNATGSIYDNGWGKYAPRINLNGNRSRYQPKIYIDGKWGSYR